MCQYFLVFVVGCIIVDVNISYAVNVLFPVDFYGYRIRQKSDCSEIS